MNPFGADPFAYFGSAAGPSAIDLLGPPASVLDLYGDGTPMASAQRGATQAAAATAVPIWQRADVLALAALVAGAWMIHAATK